jgi:hypothetical protein
VRLRAPPSSSDATGGVDGAGGAPEAAVDGGRGKVGGGSSTAAVGKGVNDFSSRPIARG